jgi:hypothetical protein
MIKLLACLDNRLIFSVPGEVLLVPLLSLLVAVTGCRCWLCGGSGKYRVGDGDGDGGVVDWVGTELVLVLVLVVW